MSSLRRLPDATACNSSKLRVDGQQFQQVGQESPSKAGFRLVLIAHPVAVPDRLPDDLAVRVEEDAVTVGGHDAGLHVDRQLFGKLRALDIKSGFGVDDGGA